MSAVLASEATLKADFDRAGRELRQSALSMAQAWQVLQRTGYSSAQLRPVALALRQFSKGCDRLRVAPLKRRAIMLENQLIPLGTDTEPSKTQLKAIEASVSSLTSSALALDLSSALPEFLKQERRAPSAPDAAAQRADAEPALATVRKPALSPQAPRLLDRNAIIVLRAERDLGAGLLEALKERGHRILELNSTQALESMLDQLLPGGLVLDARFLNGLSRQMHQLKQRPGTTESGVSIVVLSDRRDLGRKLLALRHGARGYFEEPIDVMAVCDALALSGTAPPETSASALHYRALLCTQNRAFALECESWLKPLSIATRVESNGIGALAACVEFAPQLLLVDASLPRQEGLRLLTELRRQLRNASLPAILFAGENSLQQREQAVAAGADEYLIEPVKYRHLISVVSSRLERFKRQVIGTQMSASSAGLQNRAELLADLQDVQDCALMFIVIDQREALMSTHPISTFAKLDEAVAAMIRPRLRVKDGMAYFQDGEYLLGLQGIGDAQLDELAEKIRASIAATKIDLGSAVESLSVTISWQKRSDQAALETLAHRVRHAARVLSQLGPNQRKAAQDVLLANPRGEENEDLPIASTLQPLLPCTGKVHGQFLLRFGWRMANNQALDYAAASARAAASGHGADFDRRMLQSALNRRADELKRGRQVRVLVQIGEHGAADAGLTAWLTQALAERKLSGAGLSLFLDVAHAHSLNRQQKNLWNTRAHELHALGMRVGLSGFTASDEELAELPNVAFDFALLPAKPKQLDERWAKLLKRVRERGAISIVHGVQTRLEIDQLRSLRVDFALSQNLAPASAHADYDFAGFARA
jgi:DNA-binding response OmpR family regulator/EAL domain-containing protein (putative c-di-GMP-specific phosphodiesterase class I)